MSLTRRHFLKSAAALASTPLAAAESKRFLGVTVLPEYIQTEGIDGVLKNLVERIGATAVATSPYVMFEADAKTGSREPPADAGAGAVRLLDRPLFGKREVFVSTAPSYAARTDLYKGLRYQPTPPTELTRREGGIVKKFITEAKKAGLKVYLQVQAAIPPGYRVQFGGPQDDDIPRLPNGKKPAGRVDKNGTLASPHILDYERALIRDLVEEYPEIDGLRPDWPEFPPYSLDSWFIDCGPHAEAYCKRKQLDFAGIKNEAAALYNKLNGGLQNADLEALLQQPMPNLQLYRLKADLVDDFLAAIRKTLTEAGGPGKELMPNAFPLPWSTISGFDFARAAKHSQGISTKLYSMHWPMMLRFYGDQIMKSNPGLDSSLLAHVLEHWFHVSNGHGPDRVESYHYPEPEEAHLWNAESMTAKVTQAQSAAGSCPVYALAHAYGPMDDFTQRMETAWKASNRRMWINRYGYMTDEKMNALGAVGRG